MINQYTDPKKAKAILSHFIESSLLSIQKRHGKLIIKVKGQAGIHQAWIAREQLNQIGLNVFPYGHEADIAAGNPTSVRITVRNLDAWSNLE